MSDVAVCPKCHARYRAPSTPTSLRCKNCGTVFHAGPVPECNNPPGLLPPQSGRIAAQNDTTLTPGQIETLWAAAVTADMDPGVTIKGPTSQKPSVPHVSAKPQTFAPKGSSKPGAHYELLDVLGEGGMGLVYAARQTSVDRLIALKMIKANVASDEAYRSKFLAEAAVTGDLDHPNIVPLYDLGVDENGAPFYAMKLVKGTPWSKTIKQNTLRENLGILQRVADAVAFAHSRGVIHRDLKPDNVMLGDYGEVLLMDWGLALSVSPQGKAEPLGEKAACGGTPAYMAPEMAKGDVANIGPRSDVYLLGAILYEIVTGKPPHTGRSAMKCLLAAAENALRPTDKKGELLDIALMAMATKPEERHASVKDFQAALRDYQSHTESIALSTLAEQALEKATHAKDYADFARAMFSFEEALKLWSANKAAIAGARTARLAYATCAFDRGDLDLAESLLSTERLSSSPLAKKVQAARRERAARTRRIRVLTYASAGLAAAVLIVVSVGFVLVKKEKDRAEGELAQRLKLEREKEEALAATRREAEAATQLGQNLLVTLTSDVARGLAQQPLSVAERENMLIEAQAAFRKALFLVPGLADAEKGMREVSLDHFALALQQKNWRQAREKLDQARSVKLPDAEYEQRGKELAAAETAREKHIRERVEALMADVQKPKREILPEVARSELISLRDPLTVDRLLPYVDSANLDCRLMAIEALAWMNDTRAIPKVLPYIQPKDPRGKGNPENIQAAAIRALCILAPEDDLKVYEALDKRLSGENRMGGAWGTLLYQQVASYYQPYLSRMTAKKEQEAQLKGGIKSAEEWAEHALRYEHAQQFDQALRCYDKALQLNPRLAAAYRGRGMAKALSGDLAGELADYTKLVELEPRSTVAYDLRAQAKAALGDLDGAIADYSEALKINPRDVWAYNGRGGARRTKGDPDGCIEDCNKSAQLDSRQHWPYQIRASAKVSKGDFDGAIADLDTALKLSPRFAWAYLDRGGARVAKGDFARAIADYDKALELDPNSQGAYFFRAKAKQLNADMAGALADYDKLVKLEPYRAWVYCHRSRIRRAAGDLDGSLADLGKALEVEPHIVFALALRGRIKRATGDLEGAIADFSKAVEIAPQNAGAYAGRRVARQAKGDLEGAVADSRKALAEYRAWMESPDFRVSQSSPFAAEPLGLYAWELLTSPDEKLRDAKAALPLARRAVLLCHGTEPEILQALALALFENGNAQEAAATQAKALKLLPSNAPDRGEYEQRLKEYEAKRTKEGQ